MSFLVVWGVALSLLIKQELPSFSLWAPLYLNNCMTSIMEHPSSRLSHELETKALSTLGTQGVNLALTYAKEHRLAPSGNKDTSVLIC